MLSVEMWTWLCAGIVVAGLCWAGVLNLRNWAGRRGIWDIPNERSAHARPVPTAGGAVLVAVVLPAFLLLSSLTDECLPRAVVYATGAALVAAVSLLDDLRGLPVWPRLVAYTIASVAAARGVGSLDTAVSALGGAAAPQWVSLVITVFWILGMTNAFNFMDGIDGIAASQAVLAGLTWCVLGWWEGLIGVGGLGCLVASACLTFLLHNWSPARIFLGDVGSTFLGYTFGVITVMAAARNGVYALAGVMAVWPFLFDTIFTFCRRLFRGENVFRAHRSHLYQRLVLTGLSQKAVVLIYVALALLGSGLAFACVPTSRLPMLIAGVAIPMAALGLWLAVILRERRCIRSGADQRAGLE
ncbi:MAG: glycosyltransferase family 4 protein [Acidobacteriota bacterium]